MGIYDWITKKKKGLELTQEEINRIMEGYMDGTVPDYQMSAFLMAVCLKGMTREEAAHLTIAMARSGEMLDLSGVGGVKIDKHSTGGVGDKTTLVVVPIVAACGVKVAKMSGRGLGFTGGTLDKLESIPGYRTDLSNERFLQIVEEVGASVIGQSPRLAPADKRMYALRDVTATVDSVPLIAASIMCKKLASGNDGIVLDVTLGSGAFMKKRKDAEELAETMVGIGERFGKKVVAVITDMDQPLGNAVGNRLEVVEAVQTLKGEGPEDLTQTCVCLAAHMLHLADKGDMEECAHMAREAIRDKRAFDKFVHMVKAHGGDEGCLTDPERMGKAPYQLPLKAVKEGRVRAMDTEGIGLASVLLGAGRKVKEDEVDPLAGIWIRKKTGDAVEKGDVLAVLHTSKEECLEAAKDKLAECYSIGNKESGRI